MMDRSGRNRSAATGIEHGVERVTEEVDMISSNPYRSWSLRPDELLVESARDRLATRDAFSRAAMPDALSQASRRRPLAPMRTTLAELGRRWARWRGPNAAGAVTPVGPPLPR
jgi:hypothetical protein